MDLLTSEIVKTNYRNKKYMSSKYDICYHMDKNAFVSSLIRKYLSKIYIRYPNYLKINISFFPYLWNKSLS